MVLIPRTFCSALVEPDYLSLSTSWLDEHFLRNDLVIAQSELKLKYPVNVRTLTYDIKRASSLSGEVMSSSLFKGGCSISHSSSGAGSLRSLILLTLKTIKYS